jgi:uncharacterized protein YcbK (DUF882 family)
MADKITQHFNWGEFACNDGTAVPTAFRKNVIDLCVDVLEPIREAWALICETPNIEVVSGWRSVAYNAKVGGAKASQHLTGKGADIRPRRLEDVRRFHRLIFDLYVDKKLPKLGGLGTYATWVHVDSHKAADGHLRRWAGSGIGSEK